MAYEKFSIYWKVKNFSFISSYEVTESPSFSLSERYYSLTYGRQFYLILDTLYPDELVRLTLKSRCGYHTKFPSCSFTFHAETSDGKYKQFHTGSTNNSEIQNGRGLYKSRSYLLDNHLEYLPDDSLTFSVVFMRTQGEFEGCQLFCLTRVPETKVTVVWEIGDLSSGVSLTTIPSPPLRFEMKTLPDSEVNMLKVTVTYSEATRAWIDVSCDVHVMEEAEEQAQIARFLLTSVSNPGSVQTGSFVISNKVFENRLQRAIERSGKLVFRFKFRIPDGQKVSAGFSQKPADFGVDETPKLFFMASSPRVGIGRGSFPSVRAGASLMPGDAGDAVVAGVSAGVENSEQKQDGDSSADPECMSVLRSLYSDPVFSDFTLSAGGRSFPVHRNILSARSVVFRAMFEADMREKRENCSEVTDVDADTLDRMLRFAYFGDFSDPDVESAAKLFAAADKYQIGALRSKCLRFLASSLSA